MGSVQVRIQIEGLGTVLSNLQRVEDRAVPNLERQARELAKAAEDAWKADTPVRTGKLMNADRSVPDGLTILFVNGVRYYMWVDEGHMTPKGWHRHGKYIPAKRRSHVEGRFMTKHLLEFLQNNITTYLSKFIEN